MFERLWVRILDIFHIELLLKLYCLFEKTKNKQKRGRYWPIFKKQLRHKKSHCDRDRQRQKERQKLKHNKRTI